MIHQMSEFEIRDDAVPVFSQEGRIMVKKEGPGIADGVPIDGMTLGFSLVPLAFVLGLAIGAKDGLFPGSFSESPFARGPAAASEPGTQAVDPVAETAIGFDAL